MGLLGLVWLCGTQFENNPYAFRIVSMALYPALNLGQLSTAPSI